MLAFGILVVSQDCEFVKELLYLTLQLSLDLGNSLGTNFGLAIEIEVRKPIKKG
jgi:hypothetical protein